MCPPGTAAPRPQSTACAPCAPGTYAYSWGSTHCKHCIAGTFASAGALCCPRVDGARERVVCCITTSPHARARSELRAVSHVPFEHHQRRGWRSCVRALGWRRHRPEPKVRVPRAASALAQRAPFQATRCPAWLLRRYAVLVSFSIFLSGLDPDVAVLRVRGVVVVVGGGGCGAPALLTTALPGRRTQAGVNAPASAIVENLVRADTAAAFNISMGGWVHSAGQPARAGLPAHLLLSLPLARRGRPSAQRVAGGAPHAAGQRDGHAWGGRLPGRHRWVGGDDAAAAQCVPRLGVTCVRCTNHPPADEEIATALEVQRLSADEPIAMLSQDPERFFGRTTKVGGGVPAAHPCTARADCLPPLCRLPAPPHRLWM